jgi:hypothetical protein
MRSRGLLAVLAIFFAFVLVSRGWTLTQGPQDECSPATATPNTETICAKAQTGCTCAVNNGNVDITQYGYCFGCRFEVTGTLSCTSPWGESEIGCDITLQCNGASQCGLTCPCTGNPFYVFALSCGVCQ